MKTELKNGKVYKLTSLVLMLVTFASIGGMVYYQKQSASKDKSIAEARLDKEKFLSEKLATEKVVYQQEKELGGLEKLKKGVEGQLIEKEERVKLLEQQMASLKRDNKRFNEVKKELEVVKAAKADLEHNLAQLNSSISSLNSELARLKSENTSLTDQNKTLAENVNTLCQSVINNAMTEVLTKRGKLTIKATQTKSVITGFDLPEDMSQNLTCQVTGPDGNVVGSLGNSGEIYISLQNEANETELTASLGMIKTKVSNTKHAMVTWNPIKKLKPGVYQIEVYSGSKNLGKTGFKLK